MESRAGVPSRKVTTLGRQVCTCNDTLQELCCKMATPASKLKIVQVTSEAEAVLRKHGGWALRKAIGRLEGSPLLITMDVLGGIGSGTTTGVMLKECCSSGLERSECRQLISGELAQKDPRLTSLFGGGGDPAVVATQKQAMLAIGRIVNGVVGTVVLATTPAGGGGAVPGLGLSTVLVTTTEEERAYADQEYDTAKKEVHIKLMSVMYNQQVRDFQLPSAPNMKKVSYWVKKESCFPDPDRVGLKQMRKKDTDSAWTCFQRILYATGTVACGLAANVELRDDGAGKVAKYGTQWLNFNCAVQLMLEVQEHVDGMADADLADVLHAVLLALHKGTQRGNETASLALSKMVAMVPTMVQAVVLRNRGGVSTPRKEKRKGEAKTPPTKKKTKGRTKGAEAPVKDAVKNGGRPDVGWVDEEDVLGPNGLPRKKGGNPKGSPCRQFALSTCQYETCSFSHAKKP